MRFRLPLFLFTIFVMSAIGATPPQAEKGFASWYGRRYQGRLTANGELFDMKQLTAAHQRLPFGSRVLVTCPATGQSVVVRINDRGPFRRGRIVDLSREAARRLGILNRGVEPVVITRIAGEVDTPGLSFAD